MTLLNVIRNRGSEEKRGVTFVKNNNQEKHLSYKDLLIGSSKILGFLQSKGIGHKDELVFQLKDNEDFINVFWAGILGGIIPVPISSGNNDEHRLKFFKVWERLNNPYLICDMEQYENLIKYAKKSGIDVSELSNKVIDIREVYNYESAGRIHESTDDDIAFIQFSSGSTGDPKGVVLKHSNLIANIEGIITDAEMNDTDRLLTWLPLSHDMGLIGCHLVPTTLNIEQVQINTNDFTRRPNLWLEKASQHKSTLLFSPNFGFRYMLKYMKKSLVIDYDLSNVRLIINGAEPISVDLCEEFLSKMSQYGLKKSTMQPSYGLAEACLAVTTPNPSEGKIITWIIDRRKMNIGEEVVFLDDKVSNYAATFVDVGYPIKHTSIRITNKDRIQLKENTVGFIEIHGTNVTSGYYNMEDKTKEVLDDKGWLNTGDIGFIRNGRLVVIGRYKDVLFLNGQNYYAHDLERIIQEVAGISLSEAEVAIGATKNYKEQTEEVVAFIKFRHSIEQFLNVEKNIKRELNFRLGVQISHVIPLKSIPKTTSGKVQRFNLVQKFEEDQFSYIVNEINDAKKQLAKKDKEGTSQIENNILTVCKEFLLDSEFGVDDNFFEIGIDSLKLTQISSSLQQFYGDKIKIADFYTNPTIRELARYIKYGNEEVEKTQNNNQTIKKSYVPNNDIAIVGISLKIANANGLDEYWDYIRNGTEAVRDFPENRRENLEEYFLKEGQTLENLKFHKASYLEEVDRFDYRYFNILPVEAIAMSPAQRIFLEAATKAVEDAGYSLGKIRGSKTGVYVGYMGDMDGYKYQQILKSSEDVTTPTGYLSSNIAGRVSYVMDLKGPNMMVDTACSSSLVALDIACSGIREGSCDQAIVGGIRIKTIPLEDGVKVGFESSDYRTRPFDSAGNGTGEGEGVIAVMIKPLSVAISEKDNIYAVIKATAVNNDGASMGLSTPNPAAQTEVIMQALEKANINPNSVSYVEAQGTGTPIGDPIEVQGLKNAYGKDNEHTQYCSIGSVRGNIGHLYEASGLSSLVKCCLMLKYKKIPPLANFKEANKEIHFEETPFYPNLNEIDWEPIDGIRRCGINNFGFSGTNCHVILEEYKDESERTPVLTGAHNFFTLTAKNKVVLGQLIEKYISYLEKKPQANIEDICFTSNVGREHHEVRLAIIVNSIEDLLLKLKHFEFKTNLSAQTYYGIHKRVKVSKITKKMGELEKEELELLSRNGNKLIFETDLNNKERQISRIAQIYARGADLSLIDLYENQQMQKVSLPSYEFEKLKCWPTFALSGKVLN